jgi:type II secretory pathway pseudopilin PulG
MELLTVISIISILLVLLAPAFTTRKSADDMNNAVYTIGGMLEQARTYAKANNTYAWIGFAGSIGSTVTGQVKVAIVASKDGTNLWTAHDSLPAASLVQVGKMMTLDNAHIGDTGTPVPNGTEFESRPTPPPINGNQYKLALASNSKYQFTAQQTDFAKWIQFNPRGEALINGKTTSNIVLNIVNYVEIGVLPTHGTSLAATINLAAIEISGYGGNVRVYRR